MMRAILLAILLAMSSIGAMAQEPPAVQIQTVNGYVTVTFVVTGTQTVVVSPEPFTSERLEADLAIWAACLSFLAVVWGGRQLLNQFRTGRDES